MSCSIKLLMGNTAYEIVFDDLDIALRFEESFADAALSGRPGERIVRLRVFGSDKFSLFEGDHAIGFELTESQLSSVLTRMFGEALRSSVSADECSMHASSVLLDGKAVCFLGKSGSGKSTLSLFASRYGPYLGDEYAVLDFAEGIVRQVPYPVQLKRESWPLFPHIRFDRYVTSGNEAFDSCFVPLRDASLSGRVLSGGVSVGAMVFPRYVAGLGEPEFSRIALCDLPELILPSLTGFRSPSGLLRDFSAFVGDRGVPLLCLEYSDGETAVPQLVRMLFGGNSKRG